MIYTPPPLTPADQRVLGAIDELREGLRYHLRTPRRWHGTLRRATLARSVQGSNSIEGYNASLEDVEAVMADEPPLDADEETTAAISGYRDAMTYVLQLGPSGPRIDASLLCSLHFMMIKHDLHKYPGQWRPGAVWVQDSQGSLVYEAPGREHLEPLIDELLEQAGDLTAPTAITAAMAHLNLTLIHPFSDGNGRMARCLQTLVLARDGTVSPEFSSIEEYLGANTQAYYGVLQQVAQGSWSPQRDTRPWIEFSLTAHYRQALVLQRRIQETAALWDGCDQIASARGLPARAADALVDAARGHRIRRSRYVRITKDSAGERISDNVATRDLADMAKAGLLTPVGEKRGRYYVASTELRSIRDGTRLPPTRRLPNPYDPEFLRDAARTPLPGI